MQNMRAFGCFVYILSRGSLRTVVGALGTGGGALVTGVARDTHDCEFCWREEDVSRLS